MLAAEPIFLHQFYSGEHEDCHSDISEPIQAGKVGSMEKSSGESEIRLQIKNASQKREGNS